MKLRIKNTEITTKVISILQIIGGLTGIGLMVSLLLKTASINGPVLLIYIIGFSLFIFSIYSGRVLFDKNRLKLGIGLSALNFLFQMLYIEFNGYAFSYSAGTSLRIGYGNGSLSFDASLITSDFTMKLFSSPESFSFQINIAALFIIWVLADIYDEKFSKRKSDITTLE